MRRRPRGARDLVTIRDLEFELRSGGSGRTVVAFACASTQRDLMTATRQLVNSPPSLSRFALSPFSTVRRLFIASGTFAKNTLRISVFHR